MEAPVSLAWIWTLSWFSRPFNHWYKSCFLAFSFSFPNGYNSKRTLSHYPLRCFEAISTFAISIEICVSVSNLLVHLIFFMAWSLWTHGWITFHYIFSVFQSIFYIEILVWSWIDFSSCFGVSILLLIGNHSETLVTSLKISVKDTLSHLPFLFCQIMFVVLWDLTSPPIQSINGVFRFF